LEKAENSALTNIYPTFRTTIFSFFTFSLRGKYLYGRELRFIKNALFFIKEAQKGKIAIWVHSDTNKKRLHFKDTAKGMDKETLRHIFKRFYSKRKSGTGLGLSFCKQAIENMRGTIECQSVQNKYTEFTIGF